MPAEAGEGATLALVGAPEAAAAAGARLRRSLCVAEQEPNREGTGSAFKRGQLQECRVVPRDRQFVQACRGLGLPP